MLSEIQAPDAAKPSRAESRMKVLLSGELRDRHGAFACRIHDISRGGACMDADRPVQAGAIVTFERGGLKVEGAVAWSRGRRFGIRFDSPIRATELLVQMSHSRAAPPSRPVLPGQPAPGVSGAAIPLFPSR
jgi:hypothetical protein